MRGPSRVDILQSLLEEEGQSARGHDEGAINLFEECQTSLREAYKEAIDASHAGSKHLGLPNSDWKTGCRQCIAERFPRYQKASEELAKVLLVCAKQLSKAPAEEQGSIGAKNAMASRDLWAYVAVAFGHLFVEMHHCPDVSSTLTEVIQACDALPTLNEAVSDVSVEILEDLAALGMGAQTPVMANGRGGDSKPLSLELYASALSRWNDDLQSRALFLNIQASDANSLASKLLENGALDLKPGRAGIVGACALHISIVGLLMPCLTPGVMESFKNKAWQSVKTVCSPSKVVSFTSSNLNDPALRQEDVNAESCVKVAIAGGFNQRDQEEDLLAVVNMASAAFYQGYVQTSGQVFLMIADWRIEDQKDLFSVAHALKSVWIRYQSQTQQQREEQTPESSEPDSFSKALATVIRDMDAEEASAFIATLLHNSLIEGSSDSGDDDGSVSSSRAAAVLSLCARVNVNAVRTLSEILVVENVLNKFEAETQRIKRTMALLPLHPSMISQITSLCTNPDFSSCVLEILPILTDAYLDVSTQGWDNEHDYELALSSALESIAWHHYRSSSSSSSSSNRRRKSSSSDSKSHSNIKPSSSSSIFLQESKKGATENGPKDSALAKELVRRMLQVANTLIERTHAFESRTFRNAYSRRLRAFLNVISASARYKYYSVMHTENAHHDKDHSLSMPRKKSSNDDEDDPFVFDLEFDFETSVIWRVWAFAVSEGLKDAIATADLSKLVARSRNPVSLSADSIPSTADLWHASWGEPLSSLSLGTPFLAPPGKAQRQGLESDVVALCKKLSNWNRVSSFLHALGCGSLLVGLAIVVEDLRSQTQPPFRRARVVITKFSNESGTVADTVANFFTSVQKRALVQQSRQRQRPGARVLAGRAVAHFIRGASSRIPTLSKAIVSTLETFVDWMPTLILDTHVFEATMDVFSEIQASASKQQQPHKDKVHSSKISNVISKWLDESARMSPSVLTALLEDYIRAKYEHSDANTLAFLQNAVNKYNVALESVETKARVSSINRGAMAVLGENASRLPDLLLDNLKKVTAGYYSNARTLGRVTLSEDSVRAEDKYGNANENGNGDEDEDEDEDENENEEDGNEDTDGNGGVDDSSDKQEEEWDKVAIEFYRLTCAVIADPTILSDELMTSLAWFPISFFSEKATRLGISCWSWLIATLSPSFATVLLSKVYRAVLSSRDENLGVFSGLRGDDSHTDLRPQLVSPLSPQNAFSSCAENNDSTIGLVEEFRVHNKLLSFFKECSITIADVSHSFRAVHEAFLIHALENELLFSRHPLSAGPLFRLLEMGLSCALHSSSPAESSAGTLLDRVYHVGFHFFECPPGYFFLKNDDILIKDAVHSLSSFITVLDQCLNGALKERFLTIEDALPRQNLPDRNARRWLPLLLTLCKCEHFRLYVWMEPLSQQTVLKQKRYDLGIEQHDQEALSRLGTAAWDISPHLAMGLSARLPSDFNLDHCFQSTVQSRLSQSYDCSEAIVYLKSTWKIPDSSARVAEEVEEEVDEGLPSSVNSRKRAKWKEYQALVYWSPCSVSLAVNLIGPRSSPFFARRASQMNKAAGFFAKTGAAASAAPVKLSKRAQEAKAAEEADEIKRELELLDSSSTPIDMAITLAGSPQYVGATGIYAMKALRYAGLDNVLDFVPQFIQALRYDAYGLLEEFLLDISSRSDIFAHRLIWNLQGEEAPPVESDTLVKRSGWTDPWLTPNRLWPVVKRVRNRVVDALDARGREYYEEQTGFFDKVTSISGKLYSVPKPERKVALVHELESIEPLPRDSRVYLPTDPSLLVRGVLPSKSSPMASAAKVPILVTFQVTTANKESRDSDADDHQHTVAEGSSLMKQALIFKVGDDTRQDVLALQLIKLCQTIVQSAGLDLYLDPYSVLPTGYEQGIIQVVPNTESRTQAGELADGGLVDIFKQKFGAPGSPAFENARQSLIRSTAGYAIASFLLWSKDRHNGNILIDNKGHLIHIDFGFILEISPGGNLGFETAAFKFSREIAELVDPPSSGKFKSVHYRHFLELCVRGYLAVRQHIDSFMSLFALMAESGLPCFGRGRPLENLYARFHPEMTEKQAADFMVDLCKDAYDKWTTTGYDVIQNLQNGYFF